MVYFLRILAEHARSAEESAGGRFARDRERHCDAGRCRAHAQQSGAQLLIAEAFMRADDPGVELQRLFA